MYEIFFFFIFASLDNKSSIVSLVACIWVLISRMIRLPSMFTFVGMLCNSTKKMILEQIGSLFLT